MCIMATSQDADPFDIVSVAAGKAQFKHDAADRACNDMTAGAHRDDDGREVVYCRDCGYVALTWGGTDE